jgi:IS5 family transposase
MRQQSLADGSFEKYRKKTCKEVFLDEMDQIIPRQELTAAIKPFYPTPKGAGRRPKGIERMLRIHFLQHWFELSDTAAEEALYDSRAMRQFVGIDLGQEPVPDETTICKFRHLMERYNLGDELFRLVNVYLEENGLKLSRGTIVDASIISAPSSTKNKARARDPEMHQTRKGNQWCVSRTQASGLWCCTEDGRWPPEAGLQEQASNHPVLLRSKGVVVSDRGKVAH